MSWESTATYYREINELTRQRHGGLVSAEILMHSVNFKTIVDFQMAGRAAFAVGTLISERPPHRTGRAQFGHPAPTLGV